MTSAREERRSYLRIWARVAWLSLETGRASLRRECITWGQGVLHCGCVCGCVGAGVRGGEGWWKEKNLKTLGSGRSKQRLWLKGALHVGNGNGTETCRKAGGTLSGIWDLGKGSKGPHLLPAPFSQKEKEAFLWKLNISLTFTQDLFYSNHSASQSPWYTRRPNTLHSNSLAVFLCLYWFVQN